MKRTSAVTRLGWVLAVLVTLAATIGGTPSAANASGTLTSGTLTSTEDGLTVKVVAEGVPAGSKPMAPGEATAPAVDWGCNATYHNSSYYIYAGSFWGITRCADCNESAWYWYNQGYWTWCWQLSAVQAELWLKPR
jgi:hypothetical protein